MSSAVEQHDPSVLRPRAIPIPSNTHNGVDKSHLNPAVDKLSSDTRSVKSGPSYNQHDLVSKINVVDSRMLSGRSTPIPEDAPPSAQSIAVARKQVRLRNRLFYTIDYVPRVSHFDPESDHHDFRGFFTLFWISLVIMVVTTVLRNIKDTGYPLRVRVWSLLSANVWELGLSDLAMVASSALVLPLHRLYRKGPKWLQWAHGGMIIQSIGEVLWLAVWIK